MDLVGALDDLGCEVLVFHFFWYGFRGWHGYVFVVVMKFRHLNFITNNPSEEVSVICLI